jgi:tetratricopeptide (TPR) repeat protein
VDRATTISVPVTAAHAQGEHLPATGSTTRKTWPAPLPEVAIPAPAATAPVVPPPPARPPEKAVVAADTMTEERLLAAAVRSLRAKRDAASALVALDAYRSRYPQGRMSVEANVLRVDALTALDRQPEALRALDELDLGRIPGGSERRLQRGELRAASGRLREALPDFDDVLSQAREPSLMERALAGRTQARQRLGDLAGARLDANEYLRRFPDGPFARQARDIAQVSP